MAATDVELQRRIASSIVPYEHLLIALLEGKVSADEFQTKYFNIYLNDHTIMPTDVFDVVDGFFAEVDAYVDDPDLREPADGDLGPDELRLKAAELLAAAGHAYARATPR